MIRIVKGSILDSLDQYLAQIVNCYTWSSAGLAAALFRKFPWADIYSSRRHRGDDSALFGSISIRENPERRPPSIINIFGQLGPGRPSPGRDCAAERLQAFSRALKEIAVLPGLQSIGFPCGIGCGLAGGNWDQCLGLLEDFAEEVTEQGVSVTLYCVNKRPHRHPIAQLDTRQ
jgi:O-acetyl-ADP-ribose deacetylase (regulator of RNase III)